MSRFHILSELVNIPKEELQGKIKCWDLIDKKTLIAFDVSGNYLIWNTHSNSVVTRGAVKSCPKSIKSLPNSHLAMILSDTFKVLNLTTDTQLTSIPLEQFKYFEALIQTSQGCSFICANSSNQKKIYFYEEGGQFKRVIHLPGGGQSVIDYLNHNRICKYDQYAVGDGGDRMFRFSVFCEKEETERVYDTQQEIKMTVVKVHALDEKRFLIIGNQEITHSKAYILTVEEEEKTQTLSDPIVISQNSFVDLLFADPHLMQIGIITQPYTQNPTAKCISGQTIQNCRSAFQIFDLQHKQLLNIVYFPEFRSRRFLSSQYMLAVDQNVGSDENFKVRFLKFVHKNLLYLHMMEKLGVGEMYKSHEILRAALKQLQE